MCVFLCSLRLCPASACLGAQCGWVCLGSCFSCAPPLLAGVLGCACARFACIPPLLAGVCCVGVCAWPRASSAPRHSGLTFWGVRALVCALRFYPAPPYWGVRCGRVCLGSGFGCALPPLAGMSGRVCVCVRAPLVPRHSWLGCAVWVCVLGSGCSRAPQLLAEVLEFVSACVRAPVVSRHSWLGCAVWVFVLRLGFRLRPATPGWGVGVCVCLCVCSACTPPLLAGVCLSSGFGCALPLPAGVLGCASLCTRSLRLYPATPAWGSAAWVCVFRVGCRLRPATPGWGVGVRVCS